MTLETTSLARSTEPQPKQVLDVLPRGSSSRDVLEALSRMIEQEQLRIGDRLPPEIEIARQLGIGRAKVREAMTAWQNMGIITRNKKAGTRLAAEVISNAIHLPVTLKLEAESLLRTHAVRRPLELETVRLAAQHASQQDRRLIAARSAELMAVFLAGEDWRAADHRFHTAIHAACGNPLFGQIIGQIQQGFHEVYEAPFGQPHLGAASIPLHAPLAEAVIGGRKTEAVRLLTKIMDMVESEIRQVMEAQRD